MYEENETKSWSEHECGLTRVGIADSKNKKGYQLPSKFEDQTYLLNTDSTPYGKDV